MNIPNRLLNYLGLLSFSCLLIGCGQSSQRLSETWTEHTTPFSKQELIQADKGHSQLIVYRPATSGQPDTYTYSANVYIDGRYLTSLRENRYKEVTLCAGAHTINVQSIRQDDAYYKKHNYAHPINLPVQETVFIKITPDQGQWYVSVEPQAQALEELADTYKQNHALKRTRASSINCQP